MKPFILFTLIVLCGCSRPHQGPDIMYHTHKVFIDGDWLQYENDDGFGCGRVERSPNGYSYTAHVINWRDINGPEPNTMWNSLYDAEKYVERWCRP
jgi:hypothetical protein